MVPLILTCFGEFQVVLDGVPLINFQTDKVRAFLIYLALEARPHTRIDLAQFLWPGYSTESANNSLRQTLHRLRQLLKEGKRDLFWLLSTRQTVQINPAAPVVVDVLTFRNLLAHCTAHDHKQLLTCQPCLARLQQAVDLYRGDFLANFTVADSNPFEEWRRITQEQLHLQVLDALTQLGYSAETAGDDEAAQRAAQRQLDLEPWLESAHRLIMRVLARRGQRAAALAQYQQCYQVLGDEFSVEPEVETRELWEAIQSGRFQRGTENAAYAPSLTLHLSEGAPKAQPAARPRTLPLAAAPLIGRDEALAEITTLLQQPAVRLLTLVGAGGMGKTRLAIEVGRTAEARFANGICFVELAAIHTPSALAVAIATALGIPLQGGEPRELLLQALRQQQLLLILDNFEQLLGEESTVVDLVGDLLMAAPAVQILVTSRERLKLRYEQIYAIPALAFAPVATLADAANMAAVRLFVQAAQCSQPHFQLTDANLATVLRICWLVQGMPLGLELAAANIDQLPPAAIADALAQSAEVLAMDWRDLPERQRSMRAVFAWSWQLLSAPEQRILCQSAVFRGGFTYGAAQAVTGATLPLLARLTDKSLLQWQVTATGERRYTMHELLRQFADEELHASGDHPVIAERHGHYYLAYLTERGPRLARSEPQEASNEILTELDNVRQAWQWAVTEGRMVELDQATYSWWQFCQFSDRTAEGRQRFEAAVAGVRQYLARLSGARAAATTAATTQLAQQLLAKLLAIHADYLFAQGRDQEMAAQADEAIRLGAESGGIEGETFGTFVRGRAAQELGQLQEAGDLWRRTLQLVTTYQPAYPESELLHEAHWMAHNWLRGNELGFGQHLSSRAHMVQALQICQALGKRRGELYCLSDLAWTDFYLFDFATAEPGFHAALALANDLGYRRSEMIVQAGLGEVLRVRGDYRQAQALMQQAAAVAAELALPYNETHILALLARLHCQLGNQSAGVLHLERLAQLLEQHKLPAECHLHHALATAISAHYAIDIEAALSWAEVALELHKQCEVPFRLVDTMLILGHTRAAAGQWESAAAAFQQALTTLQQFGNQPLAAEAQAGLAQIALAQGELASAQAQLEAFLPVLDEQSRAGYNNPFFLYLIGYRVLTANGDPRATALLQHGYTLLHEDAATLDGESRQRFLTDIPIHRELIAAWKTLQQQEEASGTVARRAVGQSGGGESDEPGAPLSLYDWGEMPGVAFFSGRAAEVAQLTGWLVPKANTPLVRLISIFGLGGMGKTTLAARVVKTLAPSFTVVIWRSLLNAPPLEELLRDWLQRLAHQHWATIPQSLDEQLRLLVDYLRQARCLLVLDNFESLFAGEEMPGLVGAMRAGYEGYDQLLQRLATVEHQSTLLLTSREQPYALNHLGRQAQVEGGPLRVLRLGGLDAQAGHHFLQSNGLVASADEVASLVENYSGNPLALQIAAATIADFFGGDVVAFRREEGNLFDGIRLVLEQQFARLTSLERDILVWLTIERQEATPATLRADFVQAVPTNVLLEALHALQSRSLIEARDGKLLLQNVIIEYTTAYLIEQVYQEIADGKMTRWQDEKINATADHALIQWEPTGRGHLVTLSFLNRFALLKAQAKEYVRQSQQRLILQPLADRLRAQHSEAQLCLLVQGLLETLRQHTPPAPGYAAGNLLNLLLCLDVDLAAYDFSGLPIWQAHLRNVNAAGLRLSGAHLRHPTFSDNFTSIQAMAFHPADELLAAGAGDGTIYLWQTADWQRIGILAGHHNTVRSLAFAPRRATVGDHALLASGGADGQIRFWHLEHGQAHLGHTRQRQGYIRALAFSHDGTVLASGGDDQTVCLWQVATGDLRHQLTGHRGRIYGIACCAPLTSGLYQGRTLLFSGGEDAHVYVWDVATGEEIAVLKAHQHPIRALACTPAVSVGTQSSDTQSSGVQSSSTQSSETAWLATADESGMIYLWDLQTLRPHHHWREDRTVIRALSFNATGTLLASAGDNGLARIWEAVQGRLLQTIQAHSRAVAAATFGVQSPFLLATSGYDHQIRLWNGTNGQTLHALHGYRSRVYVAHFQPPAGKLLATGHADGIVRLWHFDAGTPRLQRQLVGNSSNVFTLAFSPDGARLASGSNDATIRLWESKTGQHLRTLYGHTQDLYSVAFSPDGQFLVSSSADQTIRLWETASGREVRRFATEGYTSWSAVFHPNGEWVASGDFDHQVRLWEVATGQLLQTWSGHRWEIEKVAFSPDGVWLASAGHDGTIRLWRVVSGTTERVLEGHTAPLWSVAFSPDGRQIVSCGEDLSVRLWDLAGATGEDVPCRVLTGHTEEIFTAVFHPDGQLIVSASSDGSIGFWETASGALRHQLSVPGPYAGMEITGVTGISNAQRAALRALGAVEEGQ